MDDMFAESCPLMPSLLELTSRFTHTRLDSPAPGSYRRLVRIVNLSVLHMEDLTRTGTETGEDAIIYKDCIAAFEKTQHHGPAEHIRDFLDDMTMQQECHGRSERSLIWIADNTEVDLISWALLRADRDSNRRSDAHKSMLESTYGVIRLQSHHRKFLRSWILTIGQASSYWLLRNYEVSRDPTTSTVSVLMLYAETLRTPSAGVFVISALLYGVFAMLQYHINRADYFQQICLITGLAAGLLLSPSVPFTVPESPVCVHIFAAATSVAMVCSACGHWVWRTFFSTREARLEKKLAEWGEDARDMDKNTHVVRFCELA